MAAFSLHDDGELRDLISRAGFGDVELRAADKDLRLPAPDEFLWQYVHWMGVTILGSR